MSGTARRGGPPPSRERHLRPGPAAGALSLAAALALAGTPPAASGAGAEATRPAPAARAVQEADTVEADTVEADSVPGDTLVGAVEQAVPDSLLPDSLRAVPDSLLPDSLLRAVGADTAGRVSLEQRREALAGAGFPSRDSLFAELGGREGYRVVEYRGKTVEFEVAGRRIRLADSAQANYGEDALRADTIVYGGRTRFVEARGGIELVGAREDPVRSDSVLYYDVSGRKGTIYRARTQFSARGANWNVEGDAIPRGRETLFVDSGRFSSCSLDPPHYHFEAGQVKVVSQDVIVAWPVVFRIGHVPVAWLPFFAHSMRPERASGILPPRFGFNDVVRTAPGMNRQVSELGYYWAIDRHMDAQATVDWFSGRYVRLNGRFRYDFMKDFIDGDLGVARSWGQGEKSLQFDWQHNQELSPNTTFKVSARFLTNSRTFKERSFDPRDQLRKISSDVGFNHRLPWANLSLSADREQSLSGGGEVNTTLPSLNLSFSPVTLFPAPPTSAGPFNNLTWNGSLRASRSKQGGEGPGEVLERSAGFDNSLRLSDFSVSASARVDNRVRTPVDTAGNPLPEEFTTEVRWQSSADYQVDLMGSTTLKPTVSLEGSAFAGDTTDGELLSAPVRTNVGASLNTDLYGFFPGFGPFSRIRHKLSPGFDWRFSPPVTVSEDRAGLPGFPRSSSGRAENTLRVSLNQTIEAKVGGDGPAAPADTGAAADTAGAEADSVAAEDGADRRAGGGGGRQQKVTLLSLRSSGLTFDFERAKQGEPALTTDQIRNNISSDLLRGLSFNVTHDLFAGSGEERSFDPFLTKIGTSFSFSSGQGLGEILGFGLSDGAGGGMPTAGGTTGFGPGGGPGGAGAGGFGGDGFGQDRTGGSVFSDDDEEPEAGSGPWNVSVEYSLVRSREEDAVQGAPDNQTLGGNVRFQPTPNWEVTWNTSYNITAGNFGSHRLRLTRQLHRWLAEFRFFKAPSGNVRFDIMVRLTDAPEIKVPYQIQTQQQAEGAGG